MSTGNDIVALAATDNFRTCQHRFYSRIISPAELSLYNQPAGGGPGGLTFPSFVWLLWSIKESVYKYVSRSNPALVFSPLKIPVSRLRTRNDFYEGMVQYDQVILYSRSFVTSETILTVVSDEQEFSQTRWGIHAIGHSDYASQSALVRTFALHFLSGVFPEASLRIIKTPDGLPTLWDRERPLDIPLSLAHHGKYVAWSYRLPANSCSYRKSAANRAASNHLRRVNLLEITGLKRF
jgi:phosphopantetheinyl transferase (holo-ACP synthase)